MKGILLAGGSGSRLSPITRIVNKHLLPIYDRPMVFFPLDLFREAGVRDVMVITGRSDAGEIAGLLGSGEDHHLSFTYRLQESPNGLPAAVGLCRSFSEGQSVMVVLGDNIILDDISGVVSTFTKGCHIFLKETPDPSRYGVAVFGADDRLVDVEEKPPVPKSTWVAVGMYLFDSTVFDRIETLAPSSRGELEITDLIRSYLREGEVTYTRLARAWFDTGTYRTLLEASLYVMNESRDGDPIFRPSRRPDARQSGSG